MTKTKKEKLDLVSCAYCSIKKGDKDILILDTNIITDMGMQNAILDIQRNLGTEFEISYEIMADACLIINEKTLTGDSCDSLTSDDLDFLADADANANVYTSIQLSYLSNHNEAEISELMADESITSISQACAVWYIQKVAEACEALKSYILQ